jgi:hypothetical protein
MSQDQSQNNFSDKTELLFLKIFRIVILLVMGLAIIIAVGLALTSLYNFTQTPKDPKPAAQAPKQDVSFDKFLKSLEPQKEEEKKEPQEQPKTKPTSSLKYLEDVTKIYRCSIDFSKAVGVEVQDNDGATASRLIEGYRENIERIADSVKNRGEPYVKDAVNFVCSTLKNEKLITAYKEKKLSGVFLKSLNFHIKEWDQIQKEIEEFEDEEESRVSKEIAAEQVRVMAAKLTAITQITIAGAAFGAFMILALYLLLSKIEGNLRHLERIKE